MALPTSYLTSTKNLIPILTSIQQAQAPKQFTHSFLQGLGFKSSSDRLIIGVLKSLAFLDSNGTPTRRYFEYLDQTQSKRVMAEALMDTYGDLYQLNTVAHTLANADLKGKIKTITQGQMSDAVIVKMISTFQALAKLADFQSVGASTPRPTPQAREKAGADGTGQEPAARPAKRSGAPAFAGLVYDIHLHLPESRDPAVYDALFQSLKSHLVE